MRWGLLLVALLLPRYTATYEQGAQADLTDTMRQITEIEQEAEAMEARVARLNGVVSAWEALRERQERTLRQVARMDGDSASALIRREKRNMERPWRQQMKKSRTISARQ